MSRHTKPGVRIRMKFDFVFDTEDPKAGLEWVDVNEFIAAGMDSLERES